MPSIVSKGRGATSGGLPIDPSQMKGAGAVTDPTLLAQVGRAGADDPAQAGDAAPPLPLAKGDASADTGSAGKVADDSDASDPNSFQARIKKALAGGAKGSQQPIDDDLLRRTMAAAAQRGQVF